MQYVIFSGGLDSTVTLSLAISDYSPEETIAVSFNYGQRHIVEVEHASTIAKVLGVKHRIINLEGLMHGSSLLGDGDIPEGNYDDKNMQSTVVNGRNLLFVSATVSLADKGDCIWAGVHAGDHHIYPDCRPGFWNPLHQLVHSAYGISVKTPFIDSNKSEIVRVGKSLEVPFDLTWSCYKGEGKTHCGKCGTCLERKEAFQNADVADPTTYKDN